MPRGPATFIIYISKDVAGYSAYRIPATFSSAHAYAGTMLGTVPFLFGAWLLEGETRINKLLLMAGMGAALMGVLLASTRTFFAIAALLVIVAALTGKMSVKARFAWVSIVTALLFVALSDERFQRFKSLGDTDMVVERISGSVNRGFWEILLEYPMGNGLGGGGTNIPHFLTNKINRPVGIENEYARILLEQGIIGLCLWIGFILWFIFGLNGFKKHVWLPGRRLGWVYCVLSLLSGLTGVGLLFAVPGTFLFLLTLGWIAVAPAAEVLPARSIESARRFPSPQMYQSASHST